MIEGSSVQCPVCEGVAFPDPPTELAELRALLREMVDWADHPKTRSVFLMAEVNINSSEDDILNAHRMWARARRIVEQSKTREGV